MSVRVALSRIFRILQKPFELDSFQRDALADDPIPRS